MTPAPTAGCMSCSSPIVAPMYAMRVSHAYRHSSECGPRRSGIRGSSIRYAMTNVVPPSRTGHTTPGTIRSPQWGGVGRAGGARPSVGGGDGVGGDDHVGLGGVVEGAA